MAMVQKNLAAAAAAVVVVTLLLTRRQRVGRTMAWSTSSFGSFTATGR
jgi:hypothetical protein